MFWKSGCIKFAESVIKRTFYNTDESIRIWLEQKFDSDGNLIKTVEYDADDNITGVNMYMPWFLLYICAFL